MTTYNDNTYDTRGEKEQVTRLIGEAGAFFVNRQMKKLLEYELIRDMQEIGYIQERVERAKKHLADMEQEVRNAEEEAEKSKRSLARYEEKRADLEAKHKKLEEMQQLRADMDDKIKGYQYYCNHLDRLYEDKKSLLAQTEEAEDFAAWLENDLKTYREELTFLEDEVRSLEDKRNILKESIPGHQSPEELAAKEREAKKELDECVARMDEARKRAEETGREIEVLTRKSKDLEEQHHQLSESRDAIVRKIQEIEFHENVEDLKAQNLELRRRKEGLVKEVEERKKDIRELASKVKELDSDRDKETQRQRFLEELALKHKDKKAQVEQLRSEMAALAAEAKGRGKLLLALRPVKDLVFATREKLEAERESYVKEFLGFERLASGEQE